MEGKEVRFGIVASSLFAVITTAASCGAVNAMHDSFTALGGMIPLINMQLGEIIVGGVGAGLYGMLLFVVLAIFVAGLMVGRTPEYVGKKIEAREVKMAMLAILVLPLMYPRLDRGRRGVAAGGGVDGQCRPARLHRGALRLHVGDRQQRLGLRGPHRQHLLLQPDACRFDVRRPLLHDRAGDGDGGLARGEEVRSRRRAGTLPTTGGLFVGLVVGVILIIGGLTFFPALALGPIVEHLAMNANTLF